MRQGGFTLIELILVIGIMGILASVTMVRSDLMQSDAELDAAVQQIVNMAKRARQQSVSVAEYRGIFPSYGLHFNVGNNREFLIYANCIADDNKDGWVDHKDNFAYNNESNQICEEAIEESIGGNEASKVETFELKNGVFIHNIKIIKPEEDPLETSSVSVNYLRPEPTVWITADVGGSEDIILTGRTDITLRDKAQKYEIDVILYSTALVEVGEKRIAN